MNKVVIDTSVIVKWFSREEGTEGALSYLERLQKGEIEIFLPELLKYELGNALVKGKNLGAKELNEALEVFYGLPLTFVSEDLDNAKESGKLARQLKITYYDAVFLSLAKSLRASLLTANPRHQRKIKGIKILSLP